MNIAIVEYHPSEALLQGYRPHAYTAIFLDIYLEGMDGVSAARKLRAVDRGAVLIFLTSSDEHMPEAFSVHAFDYIPKPAARDRVFAALNDILLKDIQYTDNAICHLTNVETVQLNVRNARELNAIWENYRLEKIRSERREKRRRQARFFLYLKGPRKTSLCRILARDQRRAGIPKRRADDERALGGTAFLPTTVCVISDLYV